MAPLETEGFDLGAERLGDAQAVDGEQRHQRMLTRGGEAGRDEERSDLVAIQPGRVRLVVQARAANMGRRGALEEPLMLDVSVEPGDRAQPPSDGGASAAALLEIPGVALDVGAPHREQTQVVLLAPGDELPQIQCVRFSGQPAVAGQEGGERVPLGVGELRIEDGGVSRSARGSHVAPPGSG
jgi:hypothetical protein